MAISIDSYACYGCSKGQPKVVHLGGAVTGLPHNLQFLCANCMTKAIKSGRLQITARPESDEAVAEPGSSDGDSISVPIVTNDDGSIAVGDMEIRW